MISIIADAFAAIEATLPEESHAEARPRPEIAAMLGGKQERGR